METSPTITATVLIDFKPLSVVSCSYHTVKGNGDDDVDVGPQSLQLLNCYYR